MYFDVNNIIECGFFRNFDVGFLTIVNCDSRINEGFLDESICPEQCNESYAPICGQNDDGVKHVFVNPCYMSMMNCQKSNNKGSIYLIQFNGKEKSFMFM